MRDVLVDISPRAQRQINSAAEWWQRNRNKAPQLFVDELEAAFAILRQSPLAGRAAKLQKFKSVRRLLLPKTRFFLYYEVRADGHVRIVSLWHQSRGMTE